MAQSAEYPAWLGSRWFQGILLFAVFAGAVSVVDSLWNGGALLGPVCSLVGISLAFSGTVRARRQHTGRL